MRWLPLCTVGLICVVGCGGRKSSLLLERQARGLMDEEPRVAQPAAWRLDPVMQTQTKGNVEVLGECVDFTLLHRSEWKQRMFQLILA